jgi:ribonuclease-3
MLGIDSGKLGEFYEVIGYKFKEPSLLVQALTHSSFSYETTKQLTGSNEVLEFLGDAVVNLVTAMVLIEKFPDKQEGDLSKMRAELVNERSLAEVARRFGLDGKLLIGRSARVPGEEIPQSILADGVEALVGAVFKEGGFKEANRFVRQFLTSLMDGMSLDGGTDYKTRLQEHTQKVHKALPEYRLENAVGPEHMKVFESSVWILGRKMGMGKGRSIKASEQEAAKHALMALEILNEGVECINPIKEKH